MTGIQKLREYADIAEAGSKPHWAAAMREAYAEIDRLRGELECASLEVQRLDRVWKTSTQKEIERLRGIISDVLLIAEKWPNDPLQTIVAPIREALGDVSERG